MKADAIIVLASGVNPDMTLPKIAKNRLDMGIKLFHEGLAPYLVCTSHYTFLEENPLNLSESTAMRTYAVANGVPEDAILAEDKSNDTLGCAYFVKLDVVIPHGFTKLAVVTSDFHIERTRYLFDKVFGGQYELAYFSVPTEKSPQREELENKQLALAKHWLDPITSGDHEAVGRLLFSKHPGYASNPEVTVEELKKSL